MKQVDLTALREIGWREWDPIGLREMTAGEWEKNGADEYDAYISEVAVGIQSGWTIEEAVQYLVDIERGHMALGEEPTSRPRAEATVRAIVELVSAQK